MLDPFGFKRIGTKAAFFVFFIVFKVTFEPFNMRFAFKGEDMGTNPVEEKPIVRNHNCAAGKVN
jgi:hypothetical protein